MGLPVLPTMRVPPLKMQVDRIAAEADHCVKCGLCIPSCPTYGQSQNEAESPRGRVALVQGLVAGRLRDTKALRAHLDRCLGCQACESVCPSGVAVVAIVDAARTLRRQRLPARWARRFRLRLLSSPKVLGPVVAAVQACRRTQVTDMLVDRFSRMLDPRLARLYRLLPNAFPISRDHRHPPPSPPGPSIGRVALFRGCVAQATEPQVTATANRLLTRLGYEVTMPADQTCCGAMHAHNGEPERAAELSERNLKAFADPECTVIITTASGCAAHLLAYPRVLETAGYRRTEAFAQRIQDISQFLCEAPWPEGIALAPLLARAAVHDPCSLRNALRQETAPYRLLSRIPGLSLHPLPGNEYCCGAAGAYVLLQPAMSDALLSEKLTHLKNDPPDLLLTSNPGCSLQLARGIRELGLPTRVLHPLQLIEQQLVVRETLT